MSGLTTQKSPLCWDNKRQFTELCVMYRCGRSCVKELQALTKVQRFSVAVMFLSSKDKTG